LLGFSFSLAFIKDALVGFIYFISLSVWEILLVVIVVSFQMVNGTRVLLLFRKLPKINEISVRRNRALQMQTALFMMSTVGSLSILYFFICYLVLVRDPYFEFRIQVMITGMSIGDFCKIISLYTGDLRNKNR